LTQGDIANEEPVELAEKADDTDPVDKFNDAVGLSTDIIEHAIGKGADDLKT